MILYFVSCDCGAFFHPDSIHCKHCCSNNNKQNKRSMTMMILHHSLASVSIMLMTWIMMSPTGFAGRATKKLPPYYRLMDELILHNKQVKHTVKSGNALPSNQKQGNVNTTPSRSATLCGAQERSKQRNGLKNMNHTCLTGTEELFTNNPELSRARSMFYDQLLNSSNSSSLWTEVETNSWQCVVDGATNVRSSKVFAETCNTVGGKTVISSMVIQCRVRSKLTADKATEFEASLNHLINCLDIVTCDNRNVLILQKKAWKRPCPSIPTSSYREVPRLFHFLHGKA